MHWLELVGLMIPVVPVVSGTGAHHCSSYTKRGVVYSGEGLCWGSSGAQAHNRGPIYTNRVSGQPAQGTMRVPEPLLRQWVCSLVHIVVVAADYMSVLVRRLGPIQRTSLNQSVAQEKVALSRRMKPVAQVVPRVVLWKRGTVAAVCQLETEAVQSPALHTGVRVPQAVKAIALWVLGRISSPSMRGTEKAYATKPASAKDSSGTSVVTEN